MTKIVVLGGSFNPPTIGHYLLMQSAIKTDCTFESLLHIQEKNPDAKRIEK